MLILGIFFQGFAKLQSSELALKAIELKDVILLSFTDF